MNNNAGHSRIGPLRIGLFRALYGFSRHAAGIGHVRVGRELMAWMSRILGLREFGYSEGWDRYGIVPLHVRETPYFLALNMAIWSQRLTIFEGEYYETRETRFLRRHLHAGDWCIDVGTNIGFHLILACGLVGNQGRCIGFEPDPVNFRLADAHLAINRINHGEVYQIALSDATGRVQLKSNGMEDVGANIRPTPTDQTLNVDCRRGDEFLSQIPIDAAGICKIDVEGAELNVLRGMENFIATHSKFSYLVEVTPKWLELMCGSTKALFSFMADYGLNPFIIEKNGHISPFFDYSEVIHQSNIVFLKYSDNNNLIEPR